MLGLLGWLLGLLVGMANVLWGITAYPGLLWLTHPDIRELLTGGPAPLHLRVVAVLVGGMLAHSCAGEVGIRLQIPLLGGATAADADGEDGEGGDGSSCDADGGYGGSWDWDGD